MLPSPTWPKAIGRMPDSFSLTPAVAQDELGDPGHRHRHVVLDRARIELRLDDRLADMPKLLRLNAAFGNHRVGNKTLLERVLQQSFQQRAKPAVGLARRHFEK